MITEDELKEAMKRHMINEYENWLHELRLNRMEQENVLRSSERIKRRLHKIHSTAFNLFGGKFATELDKLDELGELDELDPLCYSRECPRKRKGRE